MLLASYTSRDCIQFAACALQPPGYGYSMFPKVARDDLKLAHHHEKRLYVR